MDDAVLYPFATEAEWLERYCKLPVHAGTGTVEEHGASDGRISLIVRRFEQTAGSTDNTQARFDASFVVPATGNCLIFLRWAGKGRLNRNFGKGLIVTGNVPEGEFRLLCPEYRIKTASEGSERPGWSVASPIHQPAIVSYGDPRPIAVVTAIINNFDFDQGNQPRRKGEEAKEVLRVEAAGRCVDFVWRAERIHLRRLVEAGVLGTTSFVTFSFSAWADATDDELAAFARNVASLCSYVVGQHTGVPVISLFDAGGRVVRRLLYGVVQSRYRPENALPMMWAEDGLPRVFRECFAKHCQMQQIDLWRRLPSFFAGIEDPPYLEQKFAALMAGLEYFISACLVEDGYLSRAEAEKKTLQPLVGMARHPMGWIIPGHYTAGERYRLLRNAVGHGGELPDGPNEVRGEFEKWKLFALRRILMRLGFTGNVASPENGWASSSPVDDFSEAHNTF